MGPFEYLDFITAGKLLEGLFRVSCFAPVNKVFIFNFDFILCYNVMSKIKPINWLYRGKNFFVYILTLRHVSTEKDANVVPRPSSILGRT